MRRILFAILFLAPWTGRSQEIRITGYNDMREMIEAFDKLYVATHPGVTFTLSLEGTRTGPPALIDGKSDLAPMGAPFTKEDLARFRQAHGTDPLIVKVAHASLSPKAKSGPLAIFVHRDNPLGPQSLAQIRAIFSEGNRFHVLGLAPETALGIYFCKEVLGGGAFRQDFTGFAQSRDVIHAIGEDPQAIGFAALNLATPQVRVVGLMAREGGVPSSGSAEDLLAGRYPLDRFLYFYARRPLSPAIRDYLAFVLSPDGQKAIAEGSLGYIALTPGEAAIERRVLDRRSPE